MAAEGAARNMIAHRGGMRPFVATLSICGKFFIRFCSGRVLCSSFLLCPAHRSPAYWCGWCAGLAAVVCVVLVSHAKLTRPQELVASPQHIWTRDGYVDLSIKAKVGFLFHSTSRVVCKLTVPEADVRC